MPSLQHHNGEKTIQDLILLFQNKQLNLEPGFQRRSVWPERDRAKLIDSILRKYPIPAVFLYKRVHNGQLIYDVIDGKQRLESILLFTGNMRGRFSTKTQLPESEETEVVDWRMLNRRGMQHLVTTYKLSVIEVDGDISDIIEVFVLINSTGRALTKQEQRNARYSHSPLLKEAARLAKKYENYFMEMGVFGSVQISRMKHIEFICELMLSVSKGDVLNKKAVLDRVMQSNSFGLRETAGASRRVVTTLNRLQKMFPKLKTTRLSQVTDFYTLALLMSKFETEGLILTDSRRNKLAWELMVAFATQVDTVRELQRKVRGAPEDQELYRDYLLTVSQMTDDVNQRRKRESSLRGVIGSIFGKKDAQRGFTAEQRRILWNTSASRVCAGSCGGKLLTWEDFTIDHIKPHSRGGASQLENAAVLCQKCNSSKGNRRLK
jgi:hypothetical protein